MIGIELDLINKRKTTNISFIGKIEFPASYIPHLIEGLDYTTFVPFIKYRTNRLFFIYWQPYTPNCLSLEYLTELRMRLSLKYYKGDIMRVTDYSVEAFDECEAHFLKGQWRNERDRVKGIFELMALNVGTFLLLFDISCTENNLSGEGITELRAIRNSLQFSENLIAN
ncbi:MAG: hypothetical protein KGD64_13185 [Candidatus Heimdallarchaeota archaeon]|nr:hypothetical protein [Candidatus Heimdallarchaeota archaeon]